MTNIQTGVAAVISSPPRFDGACFLFTKGWLSEKRTFYPGNQSLPSEVFPKGAGLCAPERGCGADSLGGCKCFDFYLWLDRSGFLITPVHFPGNTGCSHMLTHSGCRAHRMPQEGGDYKGEGLGSRGEWAGVGRRQRQLGGLCGIDCSQTVCRPRIRDGSWLATITGALP